MEGADAPRSSARRGARPGDSCPIAELPNELLSAIFDLIPHRPRLLAVSTVCRLWRDVVLRLITRLAPARRSRHSPPIDDLLALFPSLTELNTSDHSELTLHLPTSLKRLDVDSSARWHIHAPASLPNLQSLGLSCRSIEQHDAAAVIAHIMAASAASITDLRISFPSPMQGTKLVEHLNVMRFPSLRSLAVAPDAEEMDLGPFFQRHLTQLTRLRASILRFTDDAPGNLWPLTALKTLEVTELLVVDEAETVEDLLCRFPCLTALSLCGVTQLVAPTRTPSPLSALTELTFDTRMAISTEPAAMSSLAQVATRLRALNLIPAIGDNGLHERIGAFEARRWLTFVTSMELSEIESENSIELVFRSCPNLAQLTLLDTSITCVTTAIERVESAKLLRLKVNNAMARHSLESVIALWRLALARFRNLHTLSLTVGAKPSRAAMAELRKLVQQSAVHGIVVLELSLVEELRDELSTEWIRVTRQE